MADAATIFNNKPFLTNTNRTGCTKLFVPCFNYNYDTLCKKKKVSSMKLEYKPNSALLSLIHNPHHSFEGGLCKK